jgi:hypothetical protein
MIPREKSSRTVDTTVLIHYPHLWRLRRKQISSLARTTTTKASCLQTRKSPATLSWFKWRVQFFLERHHRLRLAPTTASTPSPSSTTAPSDSTSPTNGPTATPSPAKPQVTTKPKTNNTTPSWLIPASHRNCHRSSHRRLSCGN